MPWGYEHATVQGEDTKRTEDYSMTFAVSIHKGLSKHFALTLPVAAAAITTDDCCERCYPSSTPLKANCSSCLTWWARSFPASFATETYSHFRDFVGPRDQCGYLEGLALLKDGEALMPRLPANAAGEHQ